MTEDDARRLLLVRAVEREDRLGDVLTPEDRSQADAAARSADGGADGFLASRARFAAARLATRHPAVARVLERSHWPDRLGWGVTLLALTMGVLANEIGNGRRLDLLAAPLLGTFVWNLAVYLGLLLALLVRRRRQGASPLAAMIGRLGTVKTDLATPIARALGRFAIDWGQAGAALSASRLARTLHMGAALFALGLVAGIYLRALAIEYRAGWESTFLGAAQVHGLLATLLGPASTVTGIALPDAGGMAALRWTGPDSGGENAGRWLHLYTATVLGFIVLPRMILGGWQALRSARLARNFPVPGREDFYIRRLLRGWEGTPGSVRLTPYAFRPDAAARGRIAGLLHEALGTGLRVHFDDAVDYGAEESWLAAATFRPEDDHHVMLFSLSATPEDENHGQFVRSLKSALPAGTLTAALIDESAFRARFAGQAGNEARIDTRQRAWQSVLAKAGVAPLFLNLASGVADDVQRIEAVLSDAGLEQRA